MSVRNVQFEAPGRTPATFRGDINGLRSLAIVPVVLMHAGVTALPGGFVGVDVFFVISGYLITGHLVRAASSGHLTLLEFWARRLRRLYPTLAVVVVVTLALAAVILSPLELPAVVMQAVASMLGVSNLLFAREATDYFGQDVQQSPLLHTWSLGVEEQFYLVLPFVVLLCFRRGLQRGEFLPRHGRRMVTWLLITIAVLSFAASVIASSLFPFWAFYGLPTRAWEFAVGGLISVCASKLNVPDLLRQALAWVGIGLVLVSLFVISGDDPYPGAIALLPVLGTGLAIFGAAHGGSAGRLLAGRPLQWIGTRSYSWYLWHWPLIVFSMILFDSESVWIGLAAAAVSLVLAAVTYRFVEAPIRAARALRASHRRTYGLMAALTAVSILFAAVIGTGGSMGRHSPESRMWAAAYQQAPPALCEKPETRSGITVCVSGDETGRETVLLIGDSHATPWVPLLDSLGIEHGYAVAVRSLVGCPAADVSVAGLGGARYAACDTFHAETLALITKLKPDVVLLANSNSYIGAILDTHGGVTEEHAQAASWENGYRTVVQTAQSAGARVIAIEDTFRPIGNPAVCMTRPLGSLERCEPDRATAMRPVETLMDVERVVQDDLGIETLTFNERLCTAAKCSIADGHVPIFRDASHISQAWAVEQADQVQALIGQF